MNVIQKVVNRFDGFQRRHGFISFPLAVMRKYGEDEAGYRAALLAYYGFLSLFPLLLVLTTILKVLHSDNELRQRIIHHVTDYFPVIGNELSSNVHTLGNTGLTLAIGIVLTLYGARGVADVLRSTVNHVWQVPHNKRPGFPNSLFRSLGIIIFGGLGLIVAPIISGYTFGFGHNLFFRIWTLVLTAIFLFTIFQFVARAASAVRRPFKDVWVGSAVATVLLMILQALGTYLITHELKHFNNLYSTFAVVLGLLYWLFLQTQIIVYAIELDSVRVLGLWPRAINQEDLTPEDRKAYRLYAHRNRFHDEEEIEVTTKKRP
jgi:YihY family inner membrane protein